MANTRTLTINSIYGYLTTNICLGNGRWIVSCICGKEFSLRVREIKKGKKCIDCRIKEHKIIKENHQYINWTTQEYLGNNYWKCICKCGNIKNVRTNLLQQKLSQSCGCLYGSIGQRYKNKPGINRNPNRKEKLYNQKFTIYKYGAKQRSLSWNLTKKEFNALLNSKCFYCNSEPSLKFYDTLFKDKFIIVNGVDRIDSLLGYELHNCVSCCKTCNIMKLNHTYSFFLNHIKKIYEVNFL